MFEYEFYYRGRYYEVRADNPDKARAIMRRDHSVTDDGGMFVSRVTRS